MKKYLLMVIACIFLSACQPFNTQSTDDLPQVASFEECVAAGYPIQESYPESCVTPDGKRFTRVIEQQQMGDIIVSQPQAEAVVSSPLKIAGQARGSWFFEGSLRAELYSNSVLVARTPLMAQSEWMTEELVPFEGELTFTSNPGEKIQLVIKNDNPSGLPENEKELVINLQTN